MDTILTVTSLNNETYTALASVPRTQRINGERNLSLFFLRGNLNDAFIDDIETGWTVNFKGDTYHLFNEREDQHGNKSFDAVLDFFHHFNGRWHIDEVDGQSMTINDSIRPLFDDSPYQLQIIDNFYANTMSYSKQQNSTERFIYFIGRHNAEFNIPIGTRTVELRNKIGVRRNDILIHEDDNLVDFNISTDTSSFCTAIKGYYRFREISEEDNTKEPTRTYDYISPMADKYGIIWGQPVHDERIDTLEGIQSATQEKQESTWKTSFEISSGHFDTPLNIGDEVRFVVPSKSINGYIRVVEIREQFDEDGDLIDASYTFGNENIASQYRQMQYDAVQDISDIMQGKKPIPFSVLPQAVREVTNVINAGDATQFYYRRNGIYGYNTENPLGVTRYNANGIGFSRDGGQTYENAMTYLGIVATAITSGTIDTNNVTIYGDEGYNRIEITGDKLKVWDSRDPEVYTEMTRGRIHANKGAFSLNGKDGRSVIFDGYMRAARVSNINFFNSGAFNGESDIVFNGMNWVWNDGNEHRIHYIDDEYKGRYMDFVIGVGLVTGSNPGTASVTITITTPDDTVAGSATYEVTATNWNLERKTIRVDLQALYNSIPDYRTVFLYMQVQVTSGTGARAAFRVNRGEFND